MKKHVEISTYFRLKPHCGKEVGHFFRAMYQLKTLVTTHPGVSVRCLSLADTTIALLVVNLSSDCLSVRAFFVSSQLVNLI